MSTLIHDLKFGLRMLAKNPGFTAVAVITLALGIGANTAIFSVVNAVLLRPLPYRDADRLVIVWEQNIPRGWTTNIVSAANFDDWRQQNTVFSDMVAVDATSFNLTGAGDPQEIDGERITANLFALLGVPPLRGRGFSPAGDEPSSPPRSHHQLWFMAAVLRRRPQSDWAPDFSRWAQPHRRGNHAARLHRCLHHIL